MPLLNIVDKKPFPVCSLYVEMTDFELGLSFGFDEEGGFSKFTTLFISALNKISTAFRIINKSSLLNIGIFVIVFIVELVF